MGMFDSYRKRVSSQGGNMGEALKNQSDVIMNETFTRDIAYRKCYIDGKPVDAKYIVYTYYSVSNTGDNVEYHLEFRPGVHYPLGTYIDIPDDVGEYHRWLIVFRSDEPQFPKYSILKCNWNLKWIKDGVIYECLGVLRSQSSYNSGVWIDYYVERPEQQGGIWLPTNSTTRTLSYNQRLLVSDPDPEGIQDPLAWRITKIDNTKPTGITRVTLYQDYYDPAKDNKDLMIADYYESNRDSVTEKEEEIDNYIHRHLKIKCTNPPAIKVGGSYKIFTAISPEGDEFDDSLVSWNIEGLDDDDYSSIINSPETIKIKAARNFNLIGTVFILKLLYDGKEADSIEVEVISL